MQRLCVLCLAGVFSGLAAGGALADNRFTVGVEGLHDRYQEPNATVDISTYYGSVTGSYEHTANGYFSALDARYSQGKEDYKSDSGTLNGEPSLETDIRVRTGLDVKMWHGHLMPYIGLGWRYYFDQGKGRQTNLGNLAYDRHISQFYIPIGGTYRFSQGDWNFAPTVEFDIFAYGQVNSHFEPIDSQLAPGDREPNITNRQGMGSSVGPRAEFMAGKQYQHFSWEAGPFVRYWTIADSKCVATTNASCLLEPHNTRLQYGGALRIGF